jgi:pimeloyl-ACP methyl ester carboxylesterase
VDDGVRGCARTPGDRGLYPDKRGSGESTGDWRDASISDLADDVLAGIAFLRAHSAVDTTAVGTLAFSQGGYVAAVVAAEEPAIAFTAGISDGTATLRDLSVMYGMLFNVARDRRGWTNSCGRM